MRVAIHGSALEPVWRESRSIAPQATRAFNAGRDHLGSDTGSQQPVHSSPIAAVNQGPGRPGDRVTGHEAIVRSREVGPFRLEGKALRPRPLHSS